MDRLNIIYVKEELSRRRQSIFSVRDFIRIFKVRSKTARAFLSFHSKRNSFKRLKMGTYILSNNPPTMFEIANYLQRPSYISFETALSLYGIIPETVYTIISATTGPSKEYNLQNQNYRYQRVKKELFFGYRLLRIKDKAVLVADKEKALLDYIYLLSLKKQSVNERINPSKIDTGKLGKYIGFFKMRIKKNRVFINLIKQLHI